MNPLPWDWVISQARFGAMNDWPPFNPADFILVIDARFKYREELREWPSLFIYEVDDVQKFTGVTPLFGCVLCAR